MDFAFQMMLDKKTNKKPLNFLNKNGDEFLCIEESMAKKYFNIRSFLLENNCEFNDNNIIKVLELIKNEYMHTYEKYNSFENYVKELRNNELLKKSYEIFPLMYAVYEICKTIKRIYPNSKMFYIPIILLIIYIIFAIREAFNTNYIEREIKELEKLRLLLNSNTKEITLCLPKNYKITKNNILYEMLYIKKNMIIDNINVSPLKVEVEVEVEVENKVEESNQDMVENNPNNDNLEVEVENKVEVNEEVNEEVNKEVNKEVNVEHNQNNIEKNQDEVENENVQNKNNVEVKKKRVYKKKENKENKETKKKSGRPKKN